MADIDKVLPNVEQTVNIPSPDDIEVAEQEGLALQEDGSPEVQENEDGSVDVNFDPFLLKKLVLHFCIDTELKFHDLFRSQGLYRFLQSWRWKQ